MSNFKRTKVAKATSVFVSLMTGALLMGGVGILPAAAATADELQAQITALLAQISLLQSQIGAVSPSASVSFTFTKNLKQGSTGVDVLNLQKVLNSNAATRVAVSGAGSPGSETSYFGPATRAAIVKFQELYTSAILAPVGLTTGTGTVGPSTRAKLNSMSSVSVVPTTPGATPTTPGATPTNSNSLPATGTGLGVVAAANQPANSMAPQGAARVPFTKVVLTAGNDGDVAVSGLVVERTGLAADAAFSEAVLLDESGVQIGIAKTFNSDHRVTLGDSFIIPKDTSRTLTIAGNMTADNSTRAGQVAYLSLVGVNTTATVTGSLPISGAGQTINASLVIGTVTMQRGSTDPGSSQTKEVGTKDYTFSAVKVTAGSTERVYLKSIRWNQTGSVSSSDVSVSTYVDGVSYPMIISTDGKYYTTNFTDNGGKGVLIDKGFSKDLAVKGEVKGGSNRTIDFDIAKRRDLYLVGELYNFGITPPQTGASVPTADTALSALPKILGMTPLRTVSAGNMTVSTSNAASSQNIAVNLNNQPFGAFTTDVKGEPISVGRIAFNITLGSEATAADVDDLTNITLVDENGAVIAGPADGTAADSAYTTSSGDGSVVFTDTVVFPTGLHTYTLKGKVGTDVTTNTTITASTTPSADFATVTGQNTGNTITPSPASAITLSQMTVKAGALTISVSSVPIAQSVIANKTNFVFAQYIIDATASGEDVRLVSLPLEYNVGAGSATDLTNCRLFDATTNVQPSGGNTVNPSAAASSTTFTFDGAGFVVTRGTARTVAIQCNVAGGSTGQYFWGIDSATSYTGASGLTSGQTIAETLVDSIGQKMTASAGGLLAVALDSGSLGYRVVNSGQTGVELSRIKFSATSEDIDVKQVAIQLTGTASNTPVDFVNRTVTLWDATTNTQIGSAVFTNSDFATSSQIAAGSFKVARDGARVLIVKADLAAISASGPLIVSGDLAIVDYDGNNTGLNGNYGTGLSSGSTITPTGADTASNGVRVMKAYPIFANVLVGSNGLVSGTTANKTLYKFKVTATGGDVALYKFTFAVSSSTRTATTSLFSLYSYGEDTSFSNPDTTFSGTGLLNSGQCFNGRSSTAAGWVNGTNVPLEIFMEKTAASCNTATTTYTVPAGKTYNFALKATVANVEDVTGSESFSVQLEGDAAYPVPANATGQDVSGNMFSVSRVDADTNDDFIWSTISTTTQVTIDDLDYSNGYLLQGLPTTNMSAETFTSTN